jgi:hypothetical protein
MGRRSLTVKEDIQSYPTGAALVREEAGRIFLNLEDLNNIEVAYKFGLDRYFTSESSMRAAVNRAYNLVLDNPSGYKILPEKAAYIQGLVTSRQIVKQPASVREEREIEEMDITKVMLGARNLAAKLVKTKLEWLDEHPSALKEESLVNLSKVLGTLFDKGQIIQGQATEHIAVLSNIDSKMDPDEALKAIVAMREQHLESQQK